VVAPGDFDRLVLVGVQLGEEAGRVDQRQPLGEADLDSAPFDVRGRRCFPGELASACF
jgi:hypothetical protein